ncbi:MAG TPA: DUF433 domain-containing protein [Bryobacteraceae bacterium]|nr:DUF433 domain-containing protein [Bryobacteraceae bacterium]
MGRPDRIVIDPEILAGKPVIRGTRLAVEFILDLLAAGQSEADIVTNYPGRYYPGDVRNPQRCSQANTQSEPDPVNHLAHAASRLAR